MGNELIKCKTQDIRQRTLFSVLDFAFVQCIATKVFFEMETCFHFLHGQHVFQDGIVPALLKGAQLIPILRKHGLDLNFIKINITVTA